jgi:hypothetical protein
MRISRMVLFLGVVCLAGAAGARAQTIGCSSDDGHRHYCKADTRNGVALTNQTSGAACQQGYSWGYDGGGIWVDHGCRAYFTLLASTGQTLYCPSDDGHKHYCEVDTRGGVALVKQRSGAGCQEGYSWGYDGRGIWVDHGCRADFVVQAAAPLGNWGGNTMVRCSSDDGGLHYCQAETRGDVELLRQRSQADCTEGYSWGFDERGIWVDKGCRGDFVVQPNERPEYREPVGGPGQSLYCASDDGRRNYCPVDTRSGAQLVKQRSDAACQEGYSWGADDRGIWVDHGCRADFVVRGRGGREHRGRACRSAIGEDRAHELVEQCRRVAPGTRAACNADNSCRVITEEVRRSCMLQGPDAPRFCEEYR